jgi:branched-chain amino acid transport system ATP-binding protein
MGHTHLHSGQVRLDGADISGMSIHRRALAGLGYVPQEREIFPSLSVKENLFVGLRPGRWTEARIFELFPQLAERRDNKGNQLSGGEQQMLAIARALLGNPEVLLMDEPTEGLAPIIVEELQRVLAALRQDEGMAIILVEQNPRIALDFAERTVVMDRGRIVYDGASAKLKADKERLDSLIGVGQD